MWCCGGGSSLHQVPVPASDIELRAVHGGSSHLQGKESASTEECESLLLVEEARPVDEPQANSPAELSREETLEQKQIQQELEQIGTQIFELRTRQTALRKRQFFIS